MPEPDEFDQFLRRSLSGKSAPSLSDEFDQRLETRRKPRQMSPKSRYLLTGYSVVGLATSLAVMLASGLRWWLVLPLILVPVAVVAVLIRPYFRSANRLRQ
ncbi:MAG: hypothetical protein QM758_29635 [Armatimonas sp.]